MARSQRRWSQRAAARRRAIVIASVVVFVIVDILLIALIVTRDDGVESDRMPGPIPTFGSSPSPSPTPAPVVNPVLSSPRLMEAVSATEVWRASTGGCAATSSVVERTVDSGQTWQLVSTPGIDLRQVLQVEPLGGGTVRLAARTGADCAVGSFASFTGGEFWASYPENLPEFVYLDGTVTAEGETVEPPCGPVTQVQSSGDSIAVVCPDVLGERSGDDGAWTTLEVRGILAVTPVEDGYTLAVWGGEGCAGVSIQMVTSPVGAIAPTVVGCDASEVYPSEVTLARFENSIWMWSGDRLRFSSDGGVTWP